MSVTVCCVLRSGGDLSDRDVRLLQRGLDKHLPAYELVCLSDVEVPCHRISLKYNWPKWWSKMEVFRPDIAGDIFYLDLDTVILRDIGHFIESPIDTVLSDFYYRWRTASGMMYVTEKTRWQVWDKWIADPVEFMQEYEKGDQKFLSTTKLEDAQRWQERFPNQVISFKRHMRPSSPFPAGPQLLVPPDEARVVCFHGEPRPRQVAHETWIQEAWS